MSKIYLLCFLLTCSIGLGWSPSTFAQQPTGDGQSQTDPSEQVDGGDNFFADCRDSLLLEPFPFLRSLIDLLSQLIEMLNQAEQLFNDIGDIDPGDIDPGDIDPGDIDPGDIDPGDIDPGDIDPGDIDPGDIDLPGGTGGTAVTNPGGYGQGPVPSVP